MIPVGYSVNKILTAEKPLPQAGRLAIFRLNGYCLLHQILGVVTEPVQSTPNNLKLSVTPDVGNVTDLCAGASVSGANLGDLLALPDAFKTPATPIDITSAAAVPGQSLKIIVKPGILEVVCTGSATGKICWMLHWTGMTPASSITEI